MKYDHRFSENVFDDGAELPVIFGKYKTLEQ
jgi:hypothetical protein